MTRGKPQLMYGCDMEVAETIRRVPFTHRKSQANLRSEETSNSASSMRPEGSINSLCVDKAVTREMARTPRKHQQNRPIAVDVCGCCGDPQRSRPTDIPPSSTARSQQHSTFSQPHRGCFDITLWCWNIFNSLRFNQ